MNNPLKSILGFVLSFIKAFFQAIVQIAWGIAGFFLLTVLLTYYNQDVSNITHLLKIIGFIQRNWGLFFLVLFFFDFLLSYGDFMKAYAGKEEKEEPLTTLTSEMIKKDAKINEKKKGKEVKL